MAEHATPKNVTYYEPTIERSFEAWLNALKDRKARSKIDTRLDRVEAGNFGDCEPVGGGVIELRIDFGPGYRVYIGEEGDEVIVLWAGAKNSQTSDIGRARRYWREYQNAKKIP